MKRSELITTICKMVEDEARLSIEQMEGKSCSTDAYKKGLYFLYDNNDTCIYVGKVGDGPFTSLYHRMVGHASGSHKQQDARWYSKIKYGKWHQFNLIENDLSRLERLAIYGMDQPVYNDCDTDEETISSLFERFVSIDDEIFN